MHVINRLMATRGTISCVLKNMFSKTATIGRWNCRCKRESSGAVPPAAVSPPGATSNDPWLHGSLREESLSLSTVGVGRKDFDLRSVEVSIVVFSVRSRTIQYPDALNKAQSASANKAFPTSKIRSRVLIKIVPGLTEGQYAPPFLPRKCA